LLLSFIESRIDDASTCHDRPIGASCQANSSLSLQEKFKAKWFHSELIESLKVTDVVLGSTEPADYRGSYTAEAKEMADIEIAM